MKINLLYYIHITNAITICKQESIIINVFFYPLNTPAGHSVKPGVHKRYTPRFGRVRVNLHKVLSIKIKGDI
jgi:hypothetical protein